MLNFSMKDMRWVTWKIQGEVKWLNVFEKHSLLLHKLKNRSFFILMLYKYFDKN